MNAHPFVKFPIDIERPGHTLRMRVDKLLSLMDTLSKMKIRPSDKVTFQSMHVRSTLAIEGNPMTHAQVYDILNLDKDPDKEDYYGCQVANMGASFIVRDFIRPGSILLDVEIGTLNSAHKVIMSNIGPTMESYAEPGELRKLNVGVGKYIAPHYEEIPYMMDQFCRWASDTPDDRGLAILHAIAAHVMFACIHPYGDGNGRMSRWIELALLIRAEIPDPIAYMLAPHYWETRAAYYKMLDIAHGLQIDGRYNDRLELDTFFIYALNGFYEQLSIQKEMLMQIPENNIL